MNPIQYCEKHGACSSGKEFAARFQTMSEVWEACDNPYWLIWMVEKEKIVTQKLAAKLVREIWHLLTDERSRAAIIAIENDCLTPGIVAAADAAADAACTAYAAAADAAADAAYAATAADAAYAAAYAAARAAARAAAASKRQVEIIKSTIKNPYTP
jgi:hypothetical protein